MAGNFFDKSNSAKVGNMLVLLILIMALFFGMKFINQVKEFSTIGMNPHDVSTIDVPGTGEVEATPDTATISFTVESKAKNVENAQSGVAKTMDKALSFLKDAGVADEDIKTSNYNSYPQYSYPCAGQFPCTDTSEQKITGYVTSENVTVKIHDVSKAPGIIDGLGSAGITGISGPDFEVADMDKVRSDARAKAIEDSKAKAKVLASQLDVKLGRIVRYSEGGSVVVPMPMMAKMDSVASSASPETSLPSGQNKYSSNIIITYEIVQ